MSGIGTIVDPWDIQTALNNYYGFIGPGDTVYLRGGTYPGNYTVSYQGTAELPITIKPYQAAGQPPERAIIDGQLVINGNYVQVDGLEVAGSGYTDRTLQTGGTGILLNTGQGHKIINCIVHDKYQGFGGGDGCVSYEVYGCIVYHNGNDSNQGHGLYIQHSNVNGAVLIENNIVFNNFGFGFHMYGNPVFANFTVQKNTTFHNGSPRNDPQRNLLLGGYSGVTNPTVSNNRLYHQMAVAQNLWIGWGVGNSVTGATITGNYSAGAQTAAYLTDCVTPTVTGNSFYGDALQYVVDTQDSFVEDYPDNTYGASDAWSDGTFLEANTYDANRAHLTIYNKTQANTVDVDVSSVFGASGTVKAYNVQDYFNDVQTLAITAGVITVNMQAANRTVETPVGWDAPAKTFPDFGTFVLIKQ